MKKRYLVKYLILKILLSFPALREYKYPIFVISSGRSASTTIWLTLSAFYTDRALSGSLPFLKSLLPSGLSAVGWWQSDQYTKNYETGVIKTHFKPDPDELHPKSKIIYIISKPSEIYTSLKLIQAEDPGNFLARHMRNYGFKPESADLEAQIPKFVEFAVFHKINEYLMNPSVLVITYEEFWSQQNYISEWLNIVYTAPPFRPRRSPQVPIQVPESVQKLDVSYHHLLNSSLWKNRFFT